MTARFAVVTLLLLLLAFSGCGQEYLESEYGRQRLPAATGSVNGTDVLAAMFESAGHEVHTRRTLVTDEMAAADTVVWFPNDRDAPRKEVCEWFDQWLVESPGRTLIFVGRDFDAEPQYWEFHLKPADGKNGDQQQAVVPSEQGADDTGTNDTGPDDTTASETPASEADASDATKTDDGVETEDGAKADDAAKDDAKDDEKKKSRACRWFTYQPGNKVTVRTLSGPWADGIDAQQTRIEIATRLVPKGDHEVLLESEVGPIVSRLTPEHADGSQIILVENGSFLLNLPLINHEHRTLAGELVAAAGETGSVVFLESGPGGPPIDPPPTDSSLWTLFEGWPLGAILLQLAVAGIIFCFARWPIFGRPKQPPGAATTDFSYHVAAVGELLGKTRDPHLGASPEVSSPTAIQAAKQASTVPHKSSSMLR